MTKTTALELTKTRFCDASKLWASANKWFPSGLQKDACLHTSGGAGNKGPVYEDTDFSENGKIFCQFSLAFSWCRRFH